MALSLEFGAIYPPPPPPAKLAHPENPHSIISLISYSFFFRHFVCIHGEGATAKYKKGSASVLFLNFLRVQGFKFCFTIFTAFDITKSVYLSPNAQLCQSLHHMCK